MTVQELLAQAKSHHAAGRLPLAEPLYRQALASDANSAEATHYLGLLLCQAGRNDEGLALMRRSIELQPLAGYYSNLGEMLRLAGQLPAALECCRQALQLDPNIAASHHNLAMVLRDLAQPEQATQYFCNALNLRPDSVPTLHCLGETFTTMRRDVDAITCFQRVLSLQPEHADAWAALGLTLVAAGRPHQAIDACRRSLALRPNDAQVQMDLSRALADAGQLDDAIATCRKAIAIGDSDGSRRSSLLILLQAKEPVDADAIFAEHIEWSRLHEQPMAPHIRPHRNSRAADRRLRVGYVSADFRQHSVAYFIEAILANHDHNTFEIVCYSDVRAADELTQRLKQHADRWCPVQTESDEQLAETIRADGIDVLVDLGGHTAANRLRTFACKPAPVQATYLGYLDTTGLRAMDWRMTDALTDPPGMTDRFHTEQLMRLPRTFACYTPPRDCPPVNDLPARETGHVTFGCFAKVRKISARTLELWARILRAVPGSRLMMVSPGLQEPPVQSRLGGLFASHGVDATRLELVGPQSMQGWLELHGKVDLMLDTYPFNGHTTTCHGLWMGVPIVTLAGSRYASRMGLSVLQNLLLPEFIAHDADQYVRTAAEIAGGIPRLAELRRTMRQRMGQSPLMDARGFTHEIEHAYRNMWRQWCATP